MGTIDATRANEPAGPESPVPMTQPLSKQNLLWTESGERRSGPVAEVALDTPVDRTYSYGVPPELGESV